MEVQEERVPSLFSIPLVLFFVALFLFIALLNGQRDLALWAILVMSVAGGAKVWSLLSLSGLTCRSSVDRLKVFPGEILSLKIIAENAKFLPVWLRLMLPVGEAIVPASTERPLPKDTAHNMEKADKPPQEPEDKRVVVDFVEYPELYEKFKTIARDNFRTVDLHILALIHEALERRPHPEEP